MIWIFILKEWKGIVSGAVVASVISLIPIAILYSGYTAQQGAITRLEADVYKTEIERDTAIATKLSAQAALKAKNDSVKMWMERHRITNERLIENVQAAQRDRERQQDAIDRRSIETTRAIQRAATTEDAIHAFAQAVLGGSSE